jgi:hypothetical protein
LMGEGTGGGDKISPSMSLSDIPYSLIDRKGCGTSPLPPGEGV